MRLNCGYEHSTATTRAKDPDDTSDDTNVTPIHNVGSGASPSSTAAPENRPALHKSAKLDNVCYDIRGPVLAAATALEAAGHQVAKLNIGNPATFGFDCPAEIIQDVAANLANAQGYSDSKGLFPARKAVQQYYQTLGITEPGIDDIYMGNGVSELVMLAMQALLNDGDEVLIPAPDFPLWTAAANLCGGTPVHYRCDESADWQPDLEHLERCITPRTRALVVINPNNPTGAVYGHDMLLALVDIARRHNLVLLADEIYDKIIYDDAAYIPLASLADDVFTLTFSGLSKSYRAAGFRTGWMMVSGARSHARDLIEGLDMLASLRLCSNVPGQYAVQTSLGGFQSIDRLVQPGGRLCEQRDLAHSMLTSIPGVTCFKPRGALYLFPRLDPKKFNLQNDEQLVLDLLQAEKILLVHGRGFNWPEPDHVRLVFLPGVDDLTGAIEGIARFLEGYRQE